jgi:hypothetical protein
MYRPTVRAAAATWLAGTAAALVVQGAFPDKFAESTAWGRNPGGSGRSRSGTSGLWSQALPSSPVIATRCGNSYAD